MEKKQTAVEWYAEQDCLVTIDFLENKISQLQLAIKKATILQQAKEIEKEQIQELQTKIEDLTAENEQYERELNELTTNK